MSNWKDKVDPRVSAYFHAMGVQIAQEERKQMNIFDVFNDPQKARDELVRLRRALDAANALIGEGANNLAAARADVERLREALRTIAGTESQLVIRQMVRGALAATAAPPVVPLVDAEALATALEGLLGDVRRQPPDILMREHDGVFVALAAYRAKHPKET